MQVHEKVEDLMYDFVEFLENNSLYLQMILEKEEWEVINAKHEQIDRKWRNSNQGRVLSRESDHNYVTYSN